MPDHEALDVLNRYKHTGRVEKRELEREGKGERGKERGKGREKESEGRDRETHTHIRTLMRKFCAKYNMLHPYQMLKEVIHMYTHTH